VLANALPSVERGSSTDSAPRHTGAFIATFRGSVPARRGALPMSGALVAGYGGEGNLSAGLVLPRIVRLLIFMFGRVKMLPRPLVTNW
jgi:hypothetical protein